VPAPIRIAVIGDFNPTYEAHATNAGALRLAAESLGIEVESRWHATDHLGAVGQALAAYDGVWLVPGSPYADRAAALEAIRFARENALPFLGTCAGFQHALIEIAHHALGLADAEHAEDRPDAERLLLVPVACPVPQHAGGAPKLSGGIAIHLPPGSRTAALYGNSTIREEYFCNYEMNPEFRPAFEAGGVRFTGFGERGEPRILELSGHPFFFATLFQPERSSRSGRAHPLITAFVVAAKAASDARNRSGATTGL
jgi:CTP synthase (UTP-ammonia lyase)